MYIELKSVLVATVLITAYALVDSGTASHHKSLSCASHDRRRHHHHQVTGRHHVVANLKRANKKLCSIVGNLTAEQYHGGRCSSTEFMRTLKCLIQFNTEVQNNYKMSQHDSSNSVEQNSCQFLTEVTSALVVVDILSEALSSNNQTSRVMRLRDRYKPVARKLNATRSALSKRHVRRSQPHRAD